MFLWHYPHDRSHWALPSKFGLSEARTFLESDWQIRNHLAYFPFCLDYTGFSPSPKDRVSFETIASTLTLDRWLYHLSMDRLQVRL